MKKLTIFIVLPFILLIYSCCNDNQLPTPKDILKGKLRTIEDDYIKGIISQDSAIRFYFNYDSSNGELEYVSIKIPFNNKDTMVPIFIINKQNNGEMYVYSNFFSQNSETRKFKINTIGKRITSVIELDTVNNTENIVAYGTYTANIIDSAFNVGDFLLYNIKFSNFIFSNQNCISYNINPPIVPPHNAFVLYQKLNYINYTIKNKLYLQNCMDISSPIKYGLFLYFLSVDDYYIIPHNQNLISDVTFYNDNATDTTKIRYDYQFTGSDVKSVKRTSFVLSDTSVKSESYQRMTYY